MATGGISSLTDQELVNRLKETKKYYEDLQREVDKRKKAASAFLSLYASVISVTTSAPSAVESTDNLGTKVEYLVLYFKLDMPYEEFETNVKRIGGYHINKVYPDVARVVAHSTTHARNLVTFIIESHMKVKQIKNPEADECTYTYRTSQKEYTNWWLDITRGMNVELMFYHDDINISGLSMDVFKVYNKVKEADTEKKHMLISSQVPLECCEFYHLVAKDNQTRIDTFLCFETVAKDTQCTLTVHSSDRSLISIAGKPLYMEKAVEKINTINRALWESFDAARQLFVRPSISGILHIEADILYNPSNIVKNQDGSVTNYTVELIKDHIRRMVATMCTITVTSTRTLNVSNYCFRVTVAAITERFTNFEKLLADDLAIADANLILVPYFGWK